MRARLAPLLACTLALTFAAPARGGVGELGPLTGLLVDEFGLAPRQVDQVLESSVVPGGCRLQR